MKSHTLIFAGLVTVFAGCSPGGGITGEQAADTSRLDHLAERHTEFADLAKAVRQYYQALQEKDWLTSYEMRTADFKHDVSKDLYLSSVAKDGGRWLLRSYRILNTHIYGKAGSNHDSAALLVMHFTESHGESYNIALWKYEGGSWLCEEPGLSELPLLRSARVPGCFTD
jgi:hypothetical protein